MSETVEIPLTQGKVALVDLDDAPKLLRHLWSAIEKGNTWYARTNVRRNGRRVTVYMHQMVIEACPAPMEVDHRNRNGLDNRRANLRLATRTDNLANSVKPKHGTSSQYKGVAWDKREGRWQAYISIAGRNRFIGYFDDEESAAAAYDQRARKHFGSFARTNFVPCR